MRRGCVIATVLVVLVIVVGGWLGYRYIRNALTLSEDLVAFNNRDSVLAHIAAKTPAPAAGTTLTPERMRLYLGAFDSVDVGWGALMSALDSMRSRTEGENTPSMGNIETWIGKSLLREIIRLPLVSRRGTVNYLNLHHMSWAEYVWIKERTVAASMITRAEYDSAMRAEIKTHMPSGRSKKDIIPRSTDGLFERVEAMRAGGTIDSAEIALVAPHRHELLTAGLPSLVGLDTDLDSKVDVGFDATGGD